MNFASLRDVIISLFVICSIGSAVEYCWASGEAVLVPYLSKHQVPMWVVSTIYLSNPVIISECILCVSLCDVHHILLLLKYLLLTQ